MSAGKTQAPLNALHDSYINGEMARAGYFAAVAAIHAQMSGYSTSAAASAWPAPRPAIPTTKGTR